MWQSKLKNVFPAASAPVPVLPVQSRLTGQPVPGPYIVLIVCNVGIAPTSALKCLEMVPGYTEPQAQKSSETFTRPAPSASPDAVPKAVGKLVNDTSKCVFCTLCAKKCPQEAIAVDRAAKTWTLEEEKCVACGICVSNCPKKCLQMKSC